MFCMETALKLLLWSDVVYESATPSEQQAIHGQPGSANGLHPPQAAAMKRAKDERLSTFERVIALALLSLQM